MKKIISTLLAWTILMGLFSGCTGVDSGNSGTIEGDNTGTSTSTPEETNPGAQGTDTSRTSLTCDALLDYLNDIATENNYSSNFISDVETKAGEKANQTVTTFSYYAGLVAAQVTEMNDFVQMIMSTAVPSKFSELNPSNSKAKNMQYAYVACMQSLYACEPKEDGNWHLEQFNSAREEGDESVSIRNYKSSEWLYIVMLSEYFVTCTASRYCNNCGNNAPVVSFSPNELLCDNCVNSSNSDNDNISNGSGSNSDSGNNSQPPATQPPTTQPPATQPPATQPPATQAPTVCSHNYAAATCTTPKTCTLCGQTSGSALGHTYSAATCTAPKTCNSCGATSGSATGHKWTSITQTVYHEEQGHYEDVQDAKKVQKYRCWLCSYAQPTYATKDAYYAHFDSVHGNESNSSFFRERYEMVEDWVYETVTVWVVDQKAYTETVIVGYQCSVCNATK